nr:hypothetical protein [Acetobacter syzygii]
MTDNEKGAFRNVIFQGDSVALMRGDAARERRFHPYRPALSGELPGPGRAHGAQ